MAFTLETLIPMINVYLQSLPLFSFSFYSHSLSLALNRIWILQVRKSFCTKPIRYYTISQFLSENLLSHSRGNESNRFCKTKFMASMACNRFSISEWLCFLWLRNMFFRTEGNMFASSSFFLRCFKSERNNFWLRYKRFMFSFHFLSLFSD